MATMDSRGRLAEQAVVRGLGWLPGTPTEVRVSGGLVLVAAGTNEVSAVSRHGHLRLPATVRHRVGLRPGDRVLLVGRPAEAVVILYPPAALDAVLTGPAADPTGEPR
jgi:bifunctional DNA-binding transcriptional regulator/antitoxin component of YhaV-PrlF toxin-antitoxin module